MPETVVETPSSPETQAHATVAPSAAAHHGHHGFDFDAINGSHNSPYPAIEWVHGHPALILNAADYALANFSTLSEAEGFAKADPAPYTEWAAQVVARKGVGYHGPEVIDLAKAMTVARDEAWFGAMPKALSFFSHQTFWSTIALTVTALILLVFARRRPEQHKPANRFQHIIEAIVLFVRDEIVKPNIKHHPEAWTPFFASLFLALLACNLFGLVPLFASATSNIFATAAFALSIFVLMLVMGIKENGPIGFWIKMVPVPWSWNPLMMMLWFFLFLMEAAQVFIRPAVLALRLFANMFAGHTVLLVFASLGFVIFASDHDSMGLTTALGAFGWVMAVALYALELLVAFLQAYVFVLLSAVFIGLCAHPEH